MYEEFDRENMFGAIWDFPENIVGALKLGNQITLSQSYSNIQNIVIAGMGGSAIGGDVVSILEKDNLDIPFVVCRGYSLPNWVNKHTLVVCSSYSGNTEETLSALDDALDKKAQVCGLVCGDRINEVEDNVFNESSRINSTFGGNLIDMVRFGIILQIINTQWLIQIYLKK